MRKLTLLFLCLFAITALAQKTPVKHPAGTAPNAEESEEQSTTKSTSSKRAQPFPGVQSPNAKVTGRWGAEISGIPVSGLQSIEGIEPYKDGEAMEQRSRPGRGRPLQFTLTREWSNDTTFIDWYQTVSKGKVERKNITVTLFDKGSDSGRMNYFNCWPTAYTPPAANSKGSTHAIESLELTCESFDYKK